jgi:hypothetical protein
MRYLRSSLLVAVMALAVAACASTGGDTDGTAPADGLGTTAPALGSPMVEDPLEEASPLAASSVAPASVAPAE